MMAMFLASSACSAQTAGAIATYGLAGVPQGYVRMDAYFSAGRPAGSLLFVTRHVAFSAPVTSLSFEFGATDWVAYVQGTGMLYSESGAALGMVTAEAVIDTESDSVRLITNGAVNSDSGRMPFIRGRELITPP